MMRGQKSRFGTGPSSDTRFGRLGRCGARVLPIAGQLALTGVVSRSLKNPHEETAGRPSGTKQAMRAANPAVKCGAILSRPSGTPLRGVTLLEVVLAMSLLVILTAMTYWFYGSSLATRERGNADAQRLRQVKSLLERMATEIRQASAISSNQRVGIRGEAERIWLNSYRVPSREVAQERKAIAPAAPEEFDLVKVEYKIARHPDLLNDEGWEIPLGLGRVEIAVPRADSAQTGEAFEDQGPRPTGRPSAEAESEADNPLLQPTEADLDAEFFGRQRGSEEVDPLHEVQWDELHAPEIKFLRFCYSDGRTWWDDWDVLGENPLPQLVMVTIGYTEEPPFDSEFVRQDQEEFCTCLNLDPPDCLPLKKDQYQMVVRVAQADPLFRSRVTRETQGYVEQITGRPTR